MKNKTKNMKHKDKIVERLLEEKQITAEEAVILLKDNSLAVNGFMDLGSKPIKIDNRVPYYEICGCSVCNCTEGNRLVNPDSSPSWRTTYTTRDSLTNTSINDQEKE